MHKENIFFPIIALNACRFDNYLITPKVIEKCKGFNFLYVDGNTKDDIFFGKQFKTVRCNRKKNHGEKLLWASAQLKNKLALELITASHMLYIKQKLTLRRLEKEFKLTHPLWFFQKCIFYRDRETLLFFVAFDIVISHVFFENVMQFLKSFRRFEGFLLQY